MAITTIKATMIDNGLLARFQRAPEAVRAEAPPLVKAVAFAGNKRIKIDMPVDTGRARASWGLWTPGDVVKESKDASQSDAVFTVSGDGLTVTQGTNVPYVEGLENGHSQQAPAGFIQRDADIMGDELMKKIGELLDRVF